MKCLSKQCTTNLLIRLCRCKVCSALLLHRIKSLLRSYVLNSESACKTLERIHISFYSLLSIHLIICYVCELYVYLDKIKYCLNQLRILIPNNIFVVLPCLLKCIKLRYILKINKGHPMNFSICDTMGQFCGKNQAR